jgi:hypothetical protein
VIVCGPRERANSMTSLNFAFAAATVHVFIADFFIGGILRVDRVTNAPSKIAGYGST